MEQLLELDKRLFLFLNSLHTPWLDQVMFYMTNTYCWLPLHAVLLFLTFKVFGKDSWVILIGLALAIAVANTISSEIMKPFFHRLRPTHEPLLENLVHTVNNYRGGLFSFASSHASNTFAPAIFFWMLFRNRFRFSGLLFLWATIVAYTRIYLGVHYPGDIIAGALIGLLCGWCGFLLVEWTLKTINRRRKRLYD